VLEVPVGRENHLILHGRGRASAEQGKIVGVQCLHELPLACYSVSLAASVLLS